jgi:hypothetical protein
MWEPRISDPTRAIEMTMKTQRFQRQVKRMSRKVTAQPIIPKEIKQRLLTNSKK